MRRAVVRGLLTIAALAMVVPAGLAQAREPVPFPSGTLNPNRCGFPIDIAAVTNNEFQDVTILPDGTTITKITGHLVVSFKNDVTGKTIVRNVSGPTTETDHPDGTGTFVGTGNNFNTFGPTSQANTGEPGLVFSSGRFTLQFDSNHVALSFSLSGTQVNGCTLLS
jgi:hypothetical protein